MTTDPRPGAPVSAHENPVLVDTHCHLDAAPFAPAEIEALLERAAAAGVQRVVTIGTDLESSHRAVALAEAHARVWASVGVSPNDLEGRPPDWLRALDRLSRSERVVAIGEIGLDYHWLRSPAEAQRDAFRAQLELAAGRGLPVVVHARDAHEDTLAMLRLWADGRPGHRRPEGVMHCFSGDLARALAFADLGMLVSLAGNVTYPGRDDLREVAAGGPEAALVLETDSPYLSPQPAAGARRRRNEPGGVRAVAERVAALRDAPLTRVAAFTTANAARLFGWAPWPE